MVSRWAPTSAARPRAVAAIMPIVGVVVVASVCVGPTVVGAFVVIAVVSISMVAFVVRIGVRVSRLSPGRISVYVETGVVGMASIAMVVASIKTCLSLAGVSATARDPVALEILARVLGRGGVTRFP